MKTRHAFFSLTAVLTAVLAAGAWQALTGQTRPPEAAAASAAQGKLYRDTVNGFSLRLPAGLEQTKVYTPTQMVSWQKRDSKNNILWTLGAVQATETAGPIDLEPYSKELAEKLRKDESYAIDSVERTTMAGKAAIVFKGLRGGGSARFWQEQAWVLTEADRWLIFTITGPADAKADLERTLLQVLTSLRLEDRKQAQASRQKALKAGAELLAGIRPEKAAAALSARPQWFLMRIGDKNVGFMLQREAAVRRENAEGFEVTIWAMSQVPGDPIRMLKRVLFAVGDGSTERWKEQFQAGPPSETTAEDGLLVGGMIICSVQQKGKVTPHEKNVPKGIYLPRATALLLPRLVDLKTPGTYAFASYTTPANDFDMRTFTVIGPERINVDGVTRDAFRLTDQAAADADPATIWVDAKGMLLRMESGEGGLVIEAVSETQVKAAIPNVDDLIQGTATWASQK